MIYVKYTSVGLSLLGKARVVSYLHSGCYEVMNATTAEPHGEELEGDPPLSVNCMWCGKRMREILLDWNHVYLLAWYGSDGHSYLTTWIDTDKTRENYITVVVTGPDVQKWGCPLWDAPANNKANPYGFPVHEYTEYQLHEVKTGEDALALAKELGGVKAMGWYFEKGFERRWHEEKASV